MLRIVEIVEARHVVPGPWLTAAAAVADGNVVVAVGFHPVHDDLRIARSIEAG
jgi:hypothetical protein